MYGRRYVQEQVVRIHTQVLVFVPTVGFNENVCFCVRRQWLEDALKENDPTSVQLFLVGTKKDLSVRSLLFKMRCNYRTVVNWSDYFI